MDARDDRQRVVIIGAGPAGLTAAHELLEAGCRDVIVLESSAVVGGLSQSVEYKGNRIDIGGHRFFSKSDWVMDWWLRMLPLADAAAVAKAGIRISYHGRSRELPGSAPAADGGRNVMLLRQRLSRIYFAGRLFDYPLKANLETALKLGLGRSAAFAASYAWAKVFPRRPERSLEDFFINRFGRLLYRQFFKEYTEKVWGAPCESISAEWGAQRVKSLSVGKALKHALLKPFRGSGLGGAQQTSLIERFLYPKYGPGLMWEVAAQRVRELGGRIEFNARVVALDHAQGRVVAVHAERADGTIERFAADAALSTMPVRDLVAALSPEAPAPAREIAAGLQYRDFIIVGLLYRRLSPGPGRSGPLNLVPDNWMYVQEPGMRVGRLQFFNNWSPWLVNGPDTVWLGMEFFCSEGDDLWTMADAALKALGMSELQKLRLAEPADCLDAVVVRMPKAYPAYLGSYARFDELREYLDAFPNLYLAGRNGLHRYNNQDHSMLSAKKAAEAILKGRADKSEIWAVNIGDEYHEEAEAKA